MALFSKDLKSRRRNFCVLLCNFFVPAFVMTVFYISIGHSPFELKLAVVNEEKPQLLSQHFLNKMDNHSISQQIYQDFRTAKLSVERGRNWGVLYIGENFTQSLLDRYLHTLDIDRATIDASTIKLFLDMTNPVIGLIIKKSVLEAFLAFERDSPQLSGSIAAISNIPISFRDPIYGKSTQGFTEFAAPGVIISVTYFIALGLMAIDLAEEKENGILERCCVSGVTVPEILLSRFLAQLLVLMVQIFCLMIVTFLFFERQSPGHTVLMALLFFLQGISGMACGFFISSVCGSKMSVIMLSVGSFYLNLFLSGIVWPVEGMPYFARLISSFMPQTIPVNAARDILSRGWNLLYTVVWGGFLVSLGWTIFFLLISTLIFSRRL